jgi:hypothetical protein
LRPVVRLEHILSECVYILYLSSRTVLDIEQIPPSPWP